MRLPSAAIWLALPWLAAPTAAPAQVAPTSPTATPPGPVLGPVSVRIEPAPSADYELEQARERIHDGRKGGTLSKNQARALRREAELSRTLTERNARDGLSYSERREADMSGRALQSLVEGERSRPHP